MKIDDFQRVSELITTLGNVNDKIEDFDKVSGDVFSFRLLTKHDYAAFWLSDDLSSGMMTRMVALVREELLRIKQQTLDQLAELGVEP